jgi:peptidoglycan/LPS O-acetylase OafA/YrhL
MPGNILLVRYVLRSAAIATLLLGIIMITAPGQLLLWFGNGSADNQHFPIYLGTALIGFSITNWLYSRFNDLSVIKPAIIGNLASLLIALIIDITSLVKDNLNQVLWLILLLHLIFAAAFLYCLIIIHGGSKHTNSRAT